MLIPKILVFCAIAATGSAIIQPSQKEITQVSDNQAQQVSNSKFNLGGYPAKSGVGPQCSEKPDRKCMVIVDPAKNPDKEGEIAQLVFKNFGGDRGGKGFYGRDDLKMAISSREEMEAFMFKLDQAEIFYYNAGVRSMETPKGGG